jgi:hypothetical protein
MNIANQLLAGNAILYAHFSALPFIFTLFAQNGLLLL